MSSLTFTETARRSRGAEGPGGRDKRQRSYLLYLLPPPSVSSDSLDVGTIFVMLYYIDCKAGVDKKQNLSNLLGPGFIISYF